MWYYCHVISYKTWEINLISDKEVKKKGEKMYKGYDMANGLPPRIYRHPDEIRSDILRITDKIRETNSMLNIRSLLIDIIADRREKTCEGLISDLEEALHEAKVALVGLRALEEELSQLREELEEAKCLI